jgi:hypothetical protein
MAVIFSLFPGSGSVGKQLSDEMHELATLGRFIHGQSKPFTVCAKVYEDAGRVFVKVNESRALPIEDSPASLTDAFQSAKLNQHRLDGVERYRTCVPHVASR